MPPFDPTPAPTPIDNAREMSRPAARKPVGPMVGTIIILILFVFGALYFWGQYINGQKEAEQLPFIPGDPSQSI